MKFRYRIVGIGCDSERRVIEGEYDCPSSSACYHHACEVAISERLTFIVSISVICPPSEAFPPEVI